MKTLPYLLVFLISLYSCPSLVSASCLGCVELDGITFYKLIPKFPYALVKFDIAFPYGEKHEAFSQFSLKAHQVTNDILCGLVGIKDYGEKENSDLGVKYNIDSEAYPVIYLFRNGVDEYVKFPADRDITVENLKEFVTENSNLYIGLDGCLKEFNALAADYVAKDKVEQDELLGKATGLLEQVTDADRRSSAKVYVAFMKKILEKGSEFVNEEKARLTKLKNGKISSAKKLELTHKLNILQSFKSISSGPKTEL